MFPTSTNPDAVRPRSILKNTSSRSYDSEEMVPPSKYSSSSSSNVFSEDGSLVDPRLLKLSRQPASSASPSRSYMSGVSPAFMSMPPVNLQSSSPIASTYSTIGASGAQKPMSSWETYSAQNLLTHRSGTSLKDKYLAKLALAKSKKKAVMLKPLNNDDTPLLESREEEIQNEGRYAVVPPLDTYLYDERNERLTNFYETAQYGDVLIVEYKDKNEYGLDVKLLCFDGEKRGVLDDLNINGFIPYQQLDPKSRIDIDNDPRDFLRCELLDIQRQSQKILLGTKGIVMPTELRTEYLLGLIDENQFPLQYKILVTERRDFRQLRFHQLLEQSPGFRNPNCIPSIACTQGLDMSQQTLMQGLSHPFSVSQLAKSLKETQNTKSANQFVSEGVRYFKQDKGVEAFQCLNKALVTDPGNVDALVARGAMFANSGNFAKSKQDLETALKINPMHVNGRKYLAEVLFTLSDEHVKSNNLDEATDCFEQLISLTTDSKDSSLILLKIHDIVDSLLKKGTSKMSTPMVDKILRFRDKLKEKISQEIQRSNSKMDSTENNGRGSTAKQKAEENDSDSQASRDKKKKKSKKKKKKEHRSRRESVSPEPKKRSYEVEKYSGRSSLRDQDDSRREQTREVEIRKRHKSKDRHKRRHESSESSASENPDVIDVEFYQLETELAAKFVRNEHEKTAEDLDALYAPRKEDLRVRVPNVGAQTLVSPKTSLSCITRTISNDSLKNNRPLSSNTMDSGNSRPYPGVQKEDVPKPVPVKSKWKTFGEQSEEEGSPIYPPGDDSFVSARGASKNLVPPPPPRFATLSATASVPERQLPFASALRGQPAGDVAPPSKIPRSNGRSRSRSRSSSKSRKYPRRRSSSGSRRNRRRSYSRSRSRSSSRSKSSRRSRSDSRSRSRSPTNSRNRFGGNKYNRHRIGQNRSSRSPDRTSSRANEGFQRFYRGKHAGFVGYDKNKQPVSPKSNGSRARDKPVRVSSRDCITIE